MAYTRVSVIAWSVVATNLFDCFLFSCHGEERLSPGLSPLLSFFSHAVREQ